MKELWLNFKTDDDEAKRVQVKGQEFIIGRHSECDLSIPNVSLSRQHVKISGFGEVFVLSDCGSTFGTKVNGEELSEPVSLNNGDLLDLGGVAQIEVEFVSDQEEEADEDSSETAAAGGVNAAGASAAGSSIPTSFFFLAPIFGLLILLCAGGGLYIALSGNSNGTRAGKDDNSVSVSPGDEDGPSKRNRKTKKDSPNPESSEAPQTQPGTEPPANQPNIVPNVPELPKNSSEVDKVRTYSASFLSRIVSKDPDAFLLDKQIQQVLPTVNKFKSSSALAGNIAELKKNSARVSALAAEKGLKSDFLAAATLAKLGNNRGDVVATAQKMAGILQKLESIIGVESADEAAVVVAAYDQGEAGSFEKMQNTLQGLSGGNIEGFSARQIRTIWFLNDRGKLKPEEFDLAIRFIAVGTIMQKPQEFNVKAEALTFN